MALKALILDVDGTLAETADVKRAAFNQTFAELGLDWVWGRVVFQQILASTQPGQEAVWFARLRQPDLAQNLRRNGTLGRIQTRQQQIYRALLESGAAQLRPGIARLMTEAITGRVKLALCSTGPRQDFETLIYNRFGPEMLDALATTVAAEDLKAPTPGLAYALCQTRLGLTPDTIMSIEDSSAGAAAAAGLGISVLATPSQYTMSDTFPATPLVLSDLGHPAAPFAVLRGNAQGYGYVTLEALRHWQDQDRMVRATAA